MNLNESKNEDLSDSEIISSTDTLDFFLDNMNQDEIFNVIDQNINDKQISPNNGFYTSKYSTKKSDKPKIILILYRISDTLVIFFLLIMFLLFIFSFIAFIFEITISFYSVIMMNYVFFISSIVSYTMAPIYQSLSHDWTNFAFSFIQVFISSPLIAFYIFYIMKSVVSLASFMSDIPSVFKDIFDIIFSFYKDLFQTFISNFLESNYELVFDGYNILSLSGVFLLALLITIFAVGFAYVLFCFDKTIILFGSICYLINTIQIFILIFPSYLYFFKSLMCRKCKEYEFIKYYILAVNGALEGFADELKEKSEDELEEQKEKLPSIEQENNNLYFDESDSIIDHQFKMIPLDQSEEEEEDTFDSSYSSDKKKKKKKPDKFIDDPYISDFVDDEKRTDYKYMNLMNMLFQLLIANEYISLYYYSISIAFDKHKRPRKIFLMYLFFILNLLVISYDIYQLTQNYSAYFLSSIIIRLLLIPLLSYYNMFSVIFNRAKDNSLNIVLYISSILTVLISIVILFCFIFTNAYQSKYRIQNLEYVPIVNNISISNKELVKHPICDYKIFNVSAFDAFGYSLGGYDVKRNKIIFDNQMKTFFGANYSKHVSYTIYEVFKQFLFIKYYDSSINTHIFAFRGYNSGPEVAFQFELLAIQYIIPFFEDIVPFYEFINEYWLSFYTDFLNSFGLNFFDNNNLMIKYVNSILDIYNNLELEEEENVLFAGINCGGVIAKIVGTILHRKSIAFISFPINNDLFQMMFDFTPSYIGLVTNVYNVDGFFSEQEPAYATNIGINMPVFDKTKFCTSGVCEINSKTDNVYRTFCTMSELCGNGNQFNYYCEKIIGKQDLETIRESLNEND